MVNLDQNNFQNTCLVMPMAVNTLMVLIISCHAAITAAAESKPDASNLLELSSVGRIRKREVEEPEVPHWWDAPVLTGRKRSQSSVSGENGWYRPGMVGKRGESDEESGPSRWYRPLVGKRRYVDGSFEHIGGGGGGGGSGNGNTWYNVGWKKRDGEADILEEYYDDDDEDSDYGPEASAVTNVWDIPQFVGKRSEGWYRPGLVGKRSEAGWYRPGLVGKRATGNGWYRPGMVGKRAAGNGWYRPGMVGKRPSSTGWYRPGAAGKRSPMNGWYRPGMTGKRFGARASPAAGETRFGNWRPKFIGKRAGAFGTWKPTFLGKRSS